MKKVCIDIGGTSIKTSLIDDDKILMQGKVPTISNQGRQGVFDSIFNAIDKYIDYSSPNSPIGISSAGDINPIDGSVIYATSTLPNYTGAKIKEVVNKKYNRDVFVLNDAMCALVAEMNFGAGIGYSDVAMLTLGTGVGGEMYLNGKLVLGDDFRGSRLGHTVYNRENRLCPCGKTGCVETFVSATGLLYTCKQNGIVIGDCNDLFTYPSNVYEPIIDIFTKDLATITNDIFAKFNLQLMIIGGGLVHTSEYWWDKYLSLLNKDVVVKKAELANDAGVIGANIITYKQVY